MVDGRMLLIFIVMISLHCMNKTNPNQKYSQKASQRNHQEGQDHYQKYLRQFNNHGNQYQTVTSPRAPLSSLINHPNAIPPNGKATEAQPSTRHCSSKGITNMLRYLEKREVVGKGGFGKVWRVQHRGNSKAFALKEMSKALVIAKKSIPSVMNEKSLLVQLDSFFLVNLLYAHQDRQNLYLLLDYLPGGDLRFHLSRRKFNEEEAKFLIVCILLGLKYLHANGVIHRDIKPENIVLDRKGYAHITDLGVARLFRPNNSCDTSGTPGYMAPEVLCRQDHSYSVDLFAVGIIAHQFMLRKRPLKGRSRKEIREEIIARQPQVKRHQIPEDWSMEAADFINRLIQRKPAQRLGTSSIDQIFKHPWLRGFPVDRIESTSIEAPWSPPCQGPSESDYESSEQTQLRDLIAQNELVLRKPQIQQLFDGYEYSRPGFRLF